MTYETAPYPVYDCHKQVKAYKIRSINYDEEGAFIVPIEKALPAAWVPHEWIAKHTPVVGGYFISYKDGYQSFSPAGPFEEGYSLVEGS